MRVSRVMRVGVVIAAASLVLASCGKDGTPDATSPGDGAGATLPTYTVAQNVDVAGSAAFAKAKSAGRITLGVKDDQPGLGKKDPTTGKFSGFDIEIAKLIAANLGFGEDKIDFKPVPSANREQAIANGDVAYYVGTYTINDKRKTQVSFVGPYYQAGQDLLVRKDDASITGPETLKGKKVCSVTGSTPIQRVRDQNLTEPANTVEFQGYSQCVDKLLTKEVDAVTTDDAILKGFAAQDKDNLRVVGKPFSQEPYGIGLGKDDKPLRDKINAVMQTALDDGTWQKIYDATLGQSGSTATKPTLDKY